MDNRAEVREFLMSRRAKVTPQEAGLPAGGSRRVPGLRRSEVAELAGVSVEYYAKLERGAIAGASAAVLDALATALRMDETERRHLLDLARAASEARTRAVGWLTRDRALVVIERDLVNLAARRRRRAPWGELWAPEWWERVILPGAAAQVTAAWWARRAPRPAIEWARLLDPSGDGGVGRDTGPRDDDERGP